MRALVVHPPASIARDFIDYPYFADLGAVQLAAVLRAAGHDVRLVSAYALPGATLAWRDDGRAHLGATVDETLAACRGDFDVAVVAYTPFHRPPARDDVLGALLAGLSATPVILADCYQSGQHYVEARGEDVLAAYPEVRAWVKYEAEITVPRLLPSLLPFSSNPSPDRVSGTHAGESVRDLDALPLPAWDLVDLPARDAFCARVVANLGRGAWAFPIDGRTLPMVTSRGCPFTCTHCSSNPGRAEGEPKTQRRLGEARMREALETLARVHGATRIEILDELANVSERHFDALLDDMEKLSLRFDVPNGLRADYLSPRHFAKMRGRVTTVSVSAESGVQRVVDEIVKKKLDLACIDRAAESAHKAGVPLMIHWIIGLPGEEPHEIRATLERALDLHERFGAFPAVQYATPLPGTALAKGRTLPVVGDWGPAFQRTPTQPGMKVSSETLLAFRRSFDARMAAARGPEKLIVNLTYACNNHCTFCAVGTRTQVDGMLSRQREHLAFYRQQGVRLVDFDGGEPTLHPELVTIVKTARALGYERVHVTSNGRLLAYEDFARKLVTSGLTSMAFSVHGPDARTHAQQVGVAEAFDQTVEGIRNAVKHAPAGVELGMNITLTKGNWDKLEGVTQLAWDLGLRWLNVQFLTPFGRATKWVAPDTAAAARVAMGVIDRWQDKMKLQIINLPVCFMPGYDRFVAPDMGKLGRRMIFVNNEDVNLGAYLAERRVHRAECEPCPHRLACGGFYELDDVPEPAWIVKAEDLVRHRVA